MNEARRIKKNAVIDAILFPVAVVWAIFDALRVSIAYQKIRKEHKCIERCGWTPPMVVGAFKINMIEAEEATKRITNEEIAR